MGFLQNPDAESDFDMERYYRTLCPDYPEFLNSYLTLPIMQRLGGVGLLCGTDWTPLFHNKFFYSRMNHSLGVALIVWNFTRDKRQTLAALLHDVATPVFSHVLDFKNGDALTQESTEAKTATLINEDMELSQQLFSEGIYKYEIDNYHHYPIADNAIPGLSADRLEYMFPSGAALDAVWSMDEIAALYSHICVLENEQGFAELGFDDAGAARVYAEKFCAVSRILQHNEDKVAMQLLADVVARAQEAALISEEELYMLEEASIITGFDKIAADNVDEEFTRLYTTFRRMTAIRRSEEPLPGCYCVSLEVKRRYVDPLVRTVNGYRRISAISAPAAECIRDLRNFRDSTYGCVPYGGGE